MTQDHSWPLLNNNLSASRSDSRQLLQVSHRLKVAASLSPYWIAPTGRFIFPPVSNRALHCQFLKQQGATLTGCLNFVGTKKKPTNKPSPKTVLASKGGDWRADGFITSKISQEKRQGKKEKNNLHRISKAPAIALQGWVTLQSCQ